MKQTYRNRCRIKTSQKIDTLTVPVLKGNSKIGIQDILIDYSQDWVKDHSRAIQSAYGKSPFFEHYRDLFWEVWSKKPDHLFSLNAEILTLCLKLLQIDVKVEITSEYQNTPPDAVKDYRNAIHPKKSFLKNDLFRPCIYNQVFGSNFAENISIIDLLFCEGPNARQILLQSTIQ